MKRDHLAPAVRERLVRLPPPYDNHYGVVPAPPPEGGLHLTDVLPRLSEASQALGRVQALAEQMEDQFQISRILKRQEAVSSSSIEGTNSTLDEILAVEDGGDETARAEARQVRDYAILLDQLVPEAQARGPDIFTLALIQRLHADVMRSDSAYKDRLGDLRQAVVWIGGGGNIAYSTWNPPPPDRVREGLLDTVDYLRNEGLQAVHQNLITRMAVAHAHFEAVHPFRDGNGRVGRLLLPLMMAADGIVPLYISPYIDAHKESYYTALKRAQQRLEWAEIVGFLADAIVGTVDELMTTRAALKRLKDDWLRRRKFRRNAASTRALDLLVNHPVLSVKRLGQLLDVSGAQASQAIEQLAAANILHERTGHRRNRVFVAGEVLTIINRPFGAEPALPERRDDPSDEGNV
ncbi:cell filamentation protein Fic [Methylobacterium sp. Leaf123]|nr:cell filamentation protein Fic [Methylobacterium sp. Leaf123]